MVPKGLEQQVGNNYENGIIEHVANKDASNETTPNKKISPQKHSWWMDFTYFTTLTCCDRRRHEVGEKNASLLKSQAMITIPWVAALCLNWDCRRCIFFSCLHKEDAFILM